MSYTALYRKFRPDEFGEVKGQEHIVKTLKNQVGMDRVGHAYLFCGTRGTGKTTVAKILAKAVNCESPVDGSPCGECEMCKKIASNTSLNVIEIDAASNNGVANIRDVIEEVRYSPAEGRYKVYIIDEVHMLSTGAFNALLKTLEEPPSYVIFILATTEAHKIPITILSRCQRYDFKRIGIDTIAKRLDELLQREGVESEDRALRYVAKVADGSMRDALSLLDQCIAFYPNEKLTYEKALEVLGAVDTVVYGRMFRAVVSGNAIDCVRLIDEMMMAGRDLTQFVNELIWYLRNLLLLDTADCGGEMVDVSAEQLKDMENDAKSVDADTLIRYIHILSELSGKLRYSPQKRVLIEIAFIKLCRPQMDEVQDLSTVTARLDAVEKQLENGVFMSGDEALNAGKTPVQTEGEKNIPKEVPESDIKKILPKAVSEDLQEVIKRWGEIIGKCDRVERTMLEHVKKVTTDSSTLILQFTDATDEAYFKMDGERQLAGLKTTISNMIGKEIEIETRTVDEVLDKQYVDLSEIINFEEIEYVD